MINVTGCKVFVQAWLIKVAEVHLKLDFQLFLGALLLASFGDEVVGEAGIVVFLVRGLIESWFFSLSSRLYFYAFHIYFVITIFVFSVTYLINMCL